MSLKAYKKQQNYESRLSKKERKMFFNGLNTSVVSDNRKFWKTVKPLFPNKGNYGNEIRLVENEEIIDDDTRVAEMIFQNCGSLFRYPWKSVYCRKC